QTEDRHDRLKHYHAAAPRNKGGGRCIRAKGRKNTPVSQNSAKPSGPMMRTPCSRTMNVDQDSEFALRGTARAASTEARSRCQSGAPGANVPSKRRLSRADPAGRLAGVGYCALQIGVTCGRRDSNPPASACRKISTAKSSREEAGWPPT